MASFEELAPGPRGAEWSSAVERAARAVASGHVLAHPTGTVYGLGGLPDRATDERIATLKGRSSGGAPVLRIAPDVPTALRELPGIRWDRRAEALALAFWPGPLTLVLPDGSARGTALRVEGHPLTREVLATLDGVMSSTSLNLAGRPPAATSSQARAVLRALPEDVRSIVLLAVGELAGPPPSTLVSLLGPGAAVLREGAVDSRAISDLMMGLHD